MIFWTGNIWIAWDIVENSLGDVTATHKTKTPPLPHRLPAVKKKQKQKQKKNKQIEQTTNANWHYTPMHYLYLWKLKNFYITSKHNTIFLYQFSKNHMASVHLLISNKSWIWFPQNEDTQQLKQLKTKIRKWETNWWC